MYCPVCRTENADPARTCGRCGEPLPFEIPPGTRLASRYEIHRLIGRGGMGSVYSARDHALGEDVAVKVLQSAVQSVEAERLRSEIRLARRVSHWNVCRIHDYGEDGDLLFVSMELLDGTDLRRLLNERGPLRCEQAFDIAIQVAAGLEAIHQVGIVHRDLKAANIMLDASGRVRVMDFGVAKSIRQPMEGVTAPGHVVGTPEYMSPEQIRGEPLDARSDIYALGVVTFELFTGHVPFKGDTPVATFLKHLHDPPPLETAERLPMALTPVLRRALAKEAGHRQTTASEMAEDLRCVQRAIRLVPDAAVREQTTAATAPRLVPSTTASPRPPAALRNRKGVLGWGLGLAGAVLVGLILALGVERGGKEQARLANEATPAFPAATWAPATQPPSPAQVVPRPEAALRQPVKTSPATFYRNADPGPRPSAHPGVTAEPAERLAERAVFPVGTVLVVRILSVLRSDRSRAGDTFDAVLEETIRHGISEITAGTPLAGRVETVGALPGREWRPFMDLSVVEMRMPGGAIPVRTAYYRVTAPPQAASGRAILIGVLAGAGLGAVLDGKQGASHGAAIGAAAGAAVGRDGAPVYSLGNRLTFRLAEVLSFPGDPLLR